MGTSQSKAEWSDDASNVLRRNTATSQSAPTSLLSASTLAKSLYFRSTTTTQCEAAAPPPEAPPLPGSAENDAITQAARSVSQYTNPGPYEQATMDAKRLVMLDTPDGFRCDINKQLSPYMAVVHSFLLGTHSIPDGRTSTYTFLTQVADEQGLLMARVDPGRGSIDGRIHRAVLGGLAMGKLQIGASADGQGDQVLADLDFGGLTWTGNLKYGSMGGGIVYGGNYFQAITPKLIMGGEGMYIAANQSLLSNYTLKYTMPAQSGDENATLPDAALIKAPRGAGVDMSGSSTMIVNYNSAQAALSFNYKRVVTPNRVTLGAELQCNPFTLDSQVLLGAEFKLQRSRIALCMDGGGRMQTVVEAKLGMAPGSPTLSFTADVDHLREEMKFGYGINIEG